MTEPTINQFTDRTIQTSATILNGAALSSEINLVGATLCGLIMPAAWDAASIGFKAASASGGTFVPLYNASGILVSVTVSTSRFVILNAADFAAMQFFKLWSQNGAGTDTNQTADRSITIITRPV